YSNLAAFSTQIGYVPQDDIIHKDLTVEQALYYTARMRLPRDFTRAQIKQRINEVLDEVEMRDRRKHMVSSLSGGERKRVSIALEPASDNKHALKKIEEDFKRSPYYERYIQEPLNRELADHQNVLATNLLIRRPKRGRPWKQFSLLSRRYLRLLSHDGGNLLL